MAKSAHMLMFKYAREYGWFSTVLTLTGSESHPTRDTWEGIDIRRLKPMSKRYRLTQRLYQARKTHGYGPLRRLSSRLLLPVAGLLSCPDNCAGAVRELEAAANQLLNEKQYDVIVSLYSPLSAHIVASRLGTAHKLPWLALTKDFYSWPDEIIPTHKPVLTNRVKRRIEANTLRHASMIATISDYMTDYIRTFMPLTPVVSLPHCYDPETYANRESSKPHSAQLVCVGRTVEFDRKGLEILFRACRDLMNENDLSVPKLKICFIGSGHEIVWELAKQYDCAQIVELNPRVNHREAIRYMCNATCLLYIQTPFGTRRRLTEYIGSRRPILAVGDFPDTMSSELLRSYGAGRIATTKEQIKHSLGQLLANKWSSDEVNGDLVISHSAGVRGRELTHIMDALSESKSL